MEGKEIDNLRLVDTRIRVVGGERRFANRFVNGGEGCGYGLLGAGIVARLEFGDFCRCFCSAEPHASPGLLRVPFQLSVSL